MGTNQDETPSNKRIGIGCLGLVLAPVLIGAALFAGTLGGDSADDPEVQQVGATRACQDWVRDQLKSPSTATFPGSPTVTGSGPWVITGQVDAQNALGGTLREDWTCNVRLDGDTFRGSATITQ